MSVGLRTQYITIYHAGWSLERLRNRIWRKYLRPLIEVFR